jgi:hypothetical protein
MRASFFLLVLCVSLFNQPTLADDEEDLPALELLGFIADFSDEDEGWTDPESVENLFSLNGGDDSKATKPAGTGLDDTVTTEQ